MKKRWFIIAFFILLASVLLADSLSDFRRFPPFITFSLPLFSLGFLLFLIRLRRRLGWGWFPIFLAFLLLLASFAGAGLLSLRYYVYSQPRQFREREMRRRALEIEDKVKALYAQAERMGKELAGRISSSGNSFSTLQLPGKGKASHWGVSLYNREGKLIFWRGNVFEAPALPLKGKGSSPFVGRNLVNVWLNFSFPLKGGKDGVILLHYLVSSELSFGHSAKEGALFPAINDRVSIRWLDFREDTAELRQVFEQYGKFFFSRPEGGREVLYYPLILKERLLGVVTIGGLTSEGYIASYGFPFRIIVFLTLLFFFSSFGVFLGLRAVRTKKIYYLLLSAGVLYGFKFLFPLFPIIKEADRISLLSPLYFASDNPLLFSRFPLEFLLGGMIVFFLVLVLSSLLYSLRKSRGGYAIASFLAASFSVFLLLLLTKVVAKEVLSSSGVNLLQLPLYSLDVPRIFLLFGIIFYSVSLFFLAFSLLRVAVDSAGNLFGKRGWVIVLLLILIPLLLYEGKEVAPQVVAFILLLMAALFEERVRNWLKGRSLASRLLFFFTLFFGGVVLFLPYLVSAHIEVAKGFIHNAFIPQLQGEEEWIRFLLSRSLEQAASSRRVRDALAFSRLGGVGTAFTIWREMPLSAYNSLLAVYDGEGKLKDLFSLNLPKVVRDSLTPGEGKIVLKEVEARIGGRAIPLLEGRITVFEGGKPLGTILALTPLGYRSLPFLLRESAYSELIRSSKLDLSEERIRSYHPVFTAYGRDGRFLFSSGDLVLPFPQKSEFDHPLSTELEVGGRRYLIFYLPSGDELLVIGIPFISFRDYPFLILGFFVLAVICFLFFAFLWFLLSLEKEGGFPSPIRFIRGSFYRRLVFVFLLLSVVPILFLTFYLHRYLGARLRMEVLRQGRETVEFARRVVEDYIVSEEGKGRTSFPLTDTLAQAVSGWINRDIDIYLQGELVASNRRELFSAGILPSRINGEIYEKLISDRIPFASATEEIGGFRYLVVSSTIDLPNESRAILSIPLTLEERGLREELADVSEVLLLSSLLLVVVASLVSYSIARRLTKPVKELTSATEEISRGNFDLTIAPTTEDELKSLVESFNRMAKNLKKQQLTLRERKDYIEKILLNATIGIISVDEKGKVTTINPAAVDILSLEEGGVGDEILSLLSSFSPLKAFILQFLSKRERLEGNIRLSLAREVRELQIRAIPLVDERGGYSGAIFIIEDITEVMKSHRLSLWAEMARIIAHEIKNPLTPIRLSAEQISQILKDRPSGYERLIERCLDTIIDQVKNLRELSSRFSTYARIPTLKLEPTPIPSLIDEVVSLYLSPFRGKIEVETDIPSDLPSLMVDRELLKRALVNIVKNAVEAMGERGRITFRGRKEGDYLLLTIEDTGPGIDEEIKEHLFEPYFSTKASGVGLGLAITKKAIEEHGGKIEIESEKGKGTKVKIWLPLP
ncbi:MAG: HAMP domain-containing protein [Acidobacteria bacterium]|nr:HAMP domain-containing protein [Acidobacteriota bacterium]